MIAHTVAMCRNRRGTIVVKALPYAGWFLLDHLE
jgi:hypothetical protein